MLFYFFAFVLGVSIGSFLNVLIDRLSQQKSIFGRSSCPHCQKTLSSSELIPIFSFIFLKGKCLGCKKPISLQYPLVEGLTGLLFVGVFWHLKNFFTPFFDFLTLFYQGFFLFGALMIISALVVIFFSDLKYMLISQEVALVGILGALFYQLTGDFFLSLNGFSFPRAVFWGILSGLFFFLLVKFTKGKGMGIGDIKVGTLMGFFLGDQRTILALFLSFFLGAIVGIGLILFKKKNLKSPVPFAPFLVFSTLFSFFASQFLSGLSLFKLFNQGI